MKEKADIRSNFSVIPPLPRLPLQQPKSQGPYAAHAIKKDYRIRANKGRGFYSKIIF